MKYVYILSQDGLPFYIGKCKDLLQRIKWHYSCKDSLRTYVRINNMLNDGLHPDVSIIGLFADCDADIVERLLIINYSNVFELTNATYNKNQSNKPSYKYIKTKRPSKEFYNKIKQIQKLWQQ